MSRGTTETVRLMYNLKEQIMRLMSELADLEEFKNDLVASEYEETKAEMLDQLREFNETLSKIETGNMSLVDELGSMQLAIQAAISNAFKTPEVIRMFAKKQPGQLRQKLSDLERDAKIGKLSQDVLSQQKLEILFALQKLGEELSASEIGFLQQHSTASMKEFEQVSSDTSASEKVLEAAASQLKTVE